MPTFSSGSKKLQTQACQGGVLRHDPKFGTKPSQDFNLKVLLAADTPVVTLVGKTWDLHVRDDLRISQKANLEMIADSIAYMKKRVDEVIFDAEHFFDGFRANPDYAIECLKAAPGRRRRLDRPVRDQWRAAARRYSRRARLSQSRDQDAAGDSLP